MLRIRKVRRYRYARYPRGRYRARVRGQLPPTGRGGAAALLLLALTEACDDGGVGVTGPPPVMPDMVTENEARQVVKQVFTENGISLQEDFPLVFRWATDSLALDVDGFNDSLQVGFEYVSEGEVGLIPTEAKAAMDAAAGGEGPHIKVLGPHFQDQQADSLMGAEIQAFVDFLRAQGIL